MFSYKESDSCYPYQRSCTLEFDGASKGNPGQAGAGAVIRADDGSMVMITNFGIVLLLLVLPTCTYNLPSNRPSGCAKV